MGIIGFGLSGIYIVYMLVIFFIQESLTYYPDLGLYLGVIPWILLACIQFNLISFVYNEEYLDLKENFVLGIITSAVILVLIAFIGLKVFMPNILMPIIFTLCVIIVIIFRDEGWTTKDVIILLIILGIGIFTILMIFFVLGLNQFDLFILCLSFAGVLIASYASNEWGGFTKYLVILILVVIISIFVLGEEILLLIKILL